MTPLLILSKALFLLFLTENPAAMLINTFTKMATDEKELEIEIHKPREGVISSLGRREAQMKQKRRYISILRIPPFPFAFQATVCRK